MGSLEIDRNKLHQMQETVEEDKKKTETKFTFTFSYKDLVDWLDFYFLPYNSL